MYIYVCVCMCVYVCVCVCVYIWIYIYVYIYIYEFHKQFKNKQTPGTSSIWSGMLLWFVDFHHSKHLELSHLIAFLSGGISLTSSIYILMHGGSQTSNYFFHNRYLTLRSSRWFALFIRKIEVWLHFTVSFYFLPLWLGNWKPPSFSVHSLSTRPPTALLTLAFPLTAWAALSLPFCLVPMTSQPEHSLPFSLPPAPHPQSLHENPMEALPDSFDTVHFSINSSPAEPEA